ncbi:SAM-dependent methyltransferase [Streptomyces sp. 3MP-14]|uniref:SAM-dependent methyltransferase n=1 Tax=Streptomyces mimosae TaxID=2586635 RepID=A0A5N6ABS5_9ACTN|nr:MULTISPECIES: SAM-dependent methyltransferase [Streptomyces]KAB8166274.1 SAM-dependent methyltransferase [Streptomyces mimosae]KAB8174067.1 SAM-dependent methyltransferase [Streptomyces sp. 3MP-14]
MDIDSSKAHSARVWNFWLGGKDWYASDRDAGEQITRVYPGIVRTARYQRMFLARAVRFLAGEAGIRQFLDLGTGLPTVDNTHEVAQRVAPDSKIVYVDNDPLVLAHARALLTSTPEGRTAYIDADVRTPERVLEQAAEVLDFSRPIAVTMLGILGHIPDEDRPGDLVRQLVAPLTPGSYLAISDGTNTNDTLNAATDNYNARLAGDYTLRSPDEVREFFDGFELLEPGVVTIESWRPELPPLKEEPPVDAYCGLGIKR